MINKILYFSLLFVFLGIIGYIILCIASNTNTEGFYDYYPGGWWWPRYTLNYPTRIYQPTRNIITDIRGPPECPNFSECGISLRRGYTGTGIGGYVSSNKYLEPVSITTTWNQPTIQPHYYFADLPYPPQPIFDYTQKYNISGEIV